MNGDLTLRVRTVVIGALVLVALVAAYLLGSGGGGAAPAQAAGDPTTPEQPRVLTMTGTGDATAVPDELSFGVGVILVRPDLAGALDAASASMARVLAAVGEYGVTKSDVQTTGLSMTPVYDYHPYDPPTISGYRVTQRATVLVRDLEQGGAAVTAAVAAGGDSARVGTLRLLVGDPDQATARARAAAVEEARTKAQEYAAAAGQDLGDVLTLREVRVQPLPTPTAAYRETAAGLADLERAVPIRAGREHASVTVQMVWQLS